MNHTPHPAATVAQLVELFLLHLAGAVAGGRKAPATRTFYRCQLAHLVRVAGHLPAAALAVGDLVGTPHTSQFTRSVRCLYRWARLPDPLDGITPPAEGQRQRTLTPGERIRLLRRCGFELKRILWFLSKCGARPQELRELRWCEVHERERVIRLVKFKARDRRKDGVRVRMIPLPVEAARVLGYWRRTRQPAGGELVFTNERGRPWTSAALRLAVARARHRARLDVGGGEQVVSYTLRHTFATEKATAGIQETALADILGHTSLATTRRYVHRRAEDLVRALDSVARPPRAG
jgi:integrase